MSGCLPLREIRSAVNSGAAAAAVAAGTRHAVETNLTIQGNRLTVITKKVTSWAAIIAVPTAITGFYGQNVPYPGFAHQSGFLTSTILILALSGGLLVVFKRLDWL